MSNVFSMMKKAVSMQREMKQIQKQLEKQSIEGSSGGVKVVAKGDLSIESIKIDPKLMDPSRPENLERTVVAACNNALGAAKKLAGGEMSKIAGGLGLGDLM